MRANEIISSHSRSSLAQQSPGAAKTGFSDALNQVVSSLSELQASADRAAESVAMGNLANLHEAVIAMQEASLALDLVVAVRNHVLDGIQELLRTQV